MTRCRIPSSRVRFRAIATSGEPGTASVIASTRGRRSRGIEPSRMRESSPPVSCSRASGWASRKRAYDVGDDFGGNLLGTTARRSLGDGSVETSRVGPTRPARSYPIARRDLVHARVEGAEADLPAEQRLDAGPRSAPQPASDEPAEERGRRGDTGPALSVRDIEVLEAEPVHDRGHATRVGAQPDGGERRHDLPQERPRVVGAEQAAYIAGGQGRRSVRAVYPSTVVRVRLDPRGTPPHHRRRVLARSTICPPRTRGTLSAKRRAVSGTSW